LQETSVSEKVFSRARERICSIIEFARTYDSLFGYFSIETIRIRIFRKHLRKLELKSGGDISAALFSIPPIKQQAA